MLKKGMKFLLYNRVSSLAVYNVQAVTSCEYEIQHTAMAMGLGTLGGVAKRIRL